MPLVQFSQDYDYHPSDDPNLTIAYRANALEGVSDECAERAIATGAATLVTSLEAPAPADEAGQEPDGR